MFLGKSEARRPIRRSKRRFEDNSTVDLHERGQGCGTVLFGTRWGSMTASFEHGNDISKLEEFSDQLTDKRLLMK
jgi:hypothetical protein